MENHDSSFGCLGCEVRTEINKFGLIPGAKCEMLVKSPGELSVRKFDMRNMLLSRRVYVCMYIYIYIYICWKTSQSEF